MTSSTQPGSTGPRGRTRVRLTVTILVSLGVLWPGVGGDVAIAQAPPQTEIELLQQPVFYGRGDDLGLRMRVTNGGTTTLQGFQIETSVYSRITSRTELHDSFNGVECCLIGGHTTPFDRTLAAGQSTTVEVDPPLSLFPGVSLEGVYPMTLTLHDSSETPIEGFTTELIYYPAEVEVPLNMSLVVPFAPQPSRGPSGVFETDVAGNYPLEDAVGPAGWLKGLVAGLEEGVDRGLRLGVAPSPRFVEELSGMSDGYLRGTETEVETVEAEGPSARSAADVLDRLQGLLQEDGVQPLPSPYGAPDLPTIYDTFSLERLSLQLDTGNSVLESQLPDVSFDRSWLFAPGSRWDEATLEQVTPFLGGVLKTFVGSTFLEDPLAETTPSCPPSPDAEPGSFTCSVGLETERSSVSAFVRDPDVQNRFAALATRGSDSLDLQHLFAETAFIHLERPGVPKRIVHATVPAHWQPRPKTSLRLFRGLARAPWLTSRTPEEGIDISVEQGDRSVIERLDDLNEKPDKQYFEDIENAEQLLQTFTELGPPDQRTERLNRNLLVAESRSWWINPAETARGHGYALASQQEIRDEFAKIRISGPDTTLTSKRSAIEVNVFNDTTYDVTVDVSFEPTDPGAIRIDESDTDELQDITVPPGGAPAINVDAIAETSGIFLVKASVRSPVSGFEVNHRDIEIRSTNFNQIALALTLGALAFLILFYVLRVIKRRRRHPEVAAESNSS